MKHFIPSLLFFALLLAISTPVAGARPVIVSGHPEAPPIMWEKSGKLTGIGPELLGEILERENVDYVIRPEGLWADVQEKAKTGAIDIIAGAYDNPERRSYMEYSVPYLKSPVVIVVRRGARFPLSSWGDLIGKRGVANLGESFGERFDAFIRDKLDVRYVPYERAFTMLAEDAADYLVIDLFPSIVYAKMLRAEDKIEYLDTPITLQQFHITISKKSPHLDLLPKINAHIRKMEEQGRIKEIIENQYKAWRRTFRERERLFSRAERMSRKAQVDFDAGARDRGLDNLMRFVEREIPYMTN